MTCRYMAGGRPPLPVGTYGTITTGRNRSGWWARARFRDLDGTTRLVERVGPTKGKAVDRLREAMRDRDRDESGGDGTVSSNTRVSELAELWFAELRTRGASPGTLRLYRGRIDNQVVPKLGDLRGRELRTPAVDRCLNAVRDENGAAVARTTRTVLSGSAGTRHARAPWATAPATPSGTRAPSGSRDAASPSRSTSARRSNCGRS
jgi:hypothetical protein